MPVPGEYGPGVWIALAGVWLGAASLAGLALAVLARRIHPQLSFVRLWIFYAALTAFLVAVVFLVGVL